VSPSLEVFRFRPLGLPGDRTKTTDVPGVNLPPSYCSKESTRGGGDPNLFFGWLSFGLPLRYPPFIESDLRA